MENGSISLVVENGNPRNSNGSTKTHLSSAKVSNGVKIGASGKWKKKKNFITNFKLRKLSCAHRNFLFVTPMNQRHIKIEFE